MKILSFFSALLGIYYFLSGVGAVIYSNFTAGSIACVLLGLCFGAFGFFNGKLKKLCKTKLLMVFKYIILSGCIFTVCFSCFLEIYGKYDNTTSNEDCIIVLGAAVKGKTVSSALKSRLDAALEYMKNNSKSIAVVSGGKGFQEEITEAEAMKNYLVSKGIDEDRIIKEEKATSTYENFKFSKEILDKRLKKGYKTALVTNNFHVLRAGLVAKDAALSCTHIGSDIYWYDLAPNCARETMAIIKYLMFK